MTDAPDGESDDPGARAPVVPGPTATPLQRSVKGRQGIWLAAAFALVIVAIGASPFWAPAIAPLLPWGQRTAPPAADAGLVARLDAIEKQAATSVAAASSAEAALAQRFDRLEAQGFSGSSLKSAIAAAQTEVQGLEKQFAATDAQSARVAGELQEIRQEEARLDARTTDLGNRLGLIEQQTQAESGAGRSDAVLLLSLLQLRAAVEVGRPFAAEYEGFTALARGLPELLAAA
jgi:hypothetical protein